MVDATTKKYPFKFLDAYTRADHDFFFGRDTEVESMYNMIFQTDLLLIYGASGTGKTSLIKCGLGGKFQSHDWLPLFIRRENNLNTSLDKALQEEVGDYENGDSLSWLEDDFTEEESIQTISPTSQKLRSIYLRYFKPIYLIFDQFEELYILGNDIEQSNFITTVKEILSVNHPVKIIISIREEYLGYLYDFEKEVPELLRKKLRVEPMNLDKVTSIFKGINSRDNSLVQIEKKEVNQVAEKLFNKIKGESKTLSIQLPYLQVFLDKLYLKATNDESRTSEAVFDNNLLNNIGDIKDVLREFLDDQVLKIAEEYTQQPETIWKILSPFVTIEGTKEPISLPQLEKRFVSFERKELDNIILSLANRRILRFNEKNQFYEIAHDALAMQIHAKRNDDDLALLEVHRLIKTQVALSPESREYFSNKQMQFVDPYLDKIHLNEDEDKFIEASREAINNQQKRKKERNQNLAIGAIVIISIMAILTLWALGEQQKAKDNLDKLESNQRIKTAEELKAFGKSYEDIGKIKEAKELYDASMNSLKDEFPKERKLLNDLEKIIDNLPDTPQE